MILRETELKGALVIELELKKDERGFFARTFDRTVFEEHGLVGTVVQSNLSYSRKAGTLRGMHYQLPPHDETKLIRCTRGAIYDVIIDLRPTSRTYMRWSGFELTEDNHKMLYIPRALANGFQTLTDNVELTYHVSEFYAPGSERGVRWDDPQFGIKWPDAAVRTISEKDRNWPDYVPER